MFKTRRKSVRSVGRVAAACAIVATVWLTGTASPAAAATPYPGQLSVVAGTVRRPVPGPATAVPLGAHDVAVDGAGDLFVADSASDVVEKVTPSGTLSVIAGNGTVGSPVAGPATGSPLDDPVGIALDGAADVFIADKGNHLVEEVTPAGGLSIFAGTGSSGRPKPGGPATSSPLADPSGVAVDASGDVYITDPGSFDVEEVNPAGTLSVIAGDGELGKPVAGSATSSPLGDPVGVAVDPSGDIFIADADNYVEKVTGGMLSVVAGNGTSGTPIPGTATSSPLYPSGVAVDNAGDVFVADDENDVVEKVTPAGILSVFAGEAGISGSPKPGAPTSSPLNAPANVAVDGAGDVFIADVGAGVVEKVTSAGRLSIVAGAIGGGPPVPGPASSSPLNFPAGAAVDGAGDVFIADAGNGVVEKVTPDGTLSVFAGTGSPGNPKPGGPAANSPLYAPLGVAVDSAGDEFNTEFENGDVDKVSPDGTLSVFAGTGEPGAPTPGAATSSQLDGPWGVAVDGAGDVFIADQGDDVVEKVTPGGTLSVFAGTGKPGKPKPGGAATSSQLDSPDGVAVDGTGDVFIADTGNRDVEKVTPDGTLSQFAGNGTGNTPVSGPATSSPLGEPVGVAVDSAGDVFIADAGNNVVEEVTPPGTLTVVAGVVGQSGPPTPGPATASTLDADGGVAVARTGDLLITDSGNNDVEEVSGIAAPAASTGTAVACSPGSVTVGGSVSCTVTVTGTEAQTAGAPTGSVTVTSTPGAGSLSESTCALTSTDGAGSASCAVSLTPSAAGGYTVAANYPGDTEHQASSGQSAAVTVSAAAPTPSPSPSPSPHPVTAGHATVGRVRVKGEKVSVSISCAGGTACAVTGGLTVRETVRHGKVTAVAARAGRVSHRTLRLASRTVTIAPGATVTLTLTLRRTAVGLLKAHRHITARLLVAQSGQQILTRTVRLAAPARHPVKRR